VRTHPDGDQDGRVTRGYLFICLQPLKPALGTRGSSGAALSQKVASGAPVTHGGPEAASGREVGAGAAGARASSGAALSQKVGAKATGKCGSLGAAAS
jgi:hypothetical protein